MGAAIAAGSQLENGICALFVIAAVKVVKIRIFINGWFHILVISQWF